jgi:transposase
MKQFLITEERKILREAHRAEGSKRRADRIKTILLLDEGMSYDKISKVLFIDDGTARRYENEYKEGGLDALLEDNYQGGVSKLNEKQIKELKKELNVKVYSSAKEICKFVKERFNIKYTDEGMVKLLIRLGFSYKKTKQVPGKADADKQIQFIKEVYKKTKEAMGEKDKMYFLDGVHPHHNSMPAYGWIPKGETREIRSNTGRKRINLNGALNIEDTEVIIREDEMINAQSTIALLKQIEEKNPETETIYAIADNARYYRAKIVTEYLETSKIQLIFLPPYSPNLNLIERLWKFLRKKVMYHKYYETFEEFKNTYFEFFENLEQYKDELSTLLTENFEITGKNFSQT